MKMNIKTIKTKSNFNWSVLLIVSLTSITTSIYHNGFAALFPFLQRDFNLTKAQLGMHATLFYFTAAFVSIYAGRLADIKGSKWSLIVSSSLLGIFYILHSIVPNFTGILFMAALTGIAMSFNMPTANKCIVEWFPSKQRSTALGLQSMAFPIGGLLGAAFLPLFGNIIGWRKTIILPGIATLVIMIFILFFYQENKKINNFQSANNEKNTSFWQCFALLIKNKELIKITILGFFLGIMSGSITAHFTLFLFFDYGLSETMAGIGFAMVQLGSIIGRGGWGLFCDKALGSNKRKAFLYMGLLFTTLALILSFILGKMNPPIAVLILISFLVGFSGNSWPGLFNAAAVETVEEQNVGITIGLALFTTRLGFMIAPPIFGYIADRKGTYSLSWFLLGIIMFIVTVSQYIFSQKYFGKYH
jgi:MFS family permease